MTNTKLLEDKIRKSGLKRNYLAKKCGLSYAGFRNCVINKATFNANHIKVLCDELQIKSLKEMQDIFFAKSGA